MNKLLITYNLIAPGQKYKALYDYIESFGHVMKGLRSQFIIKTEKSATQIMDELVGLVDQNDQILVVDITNSDWDTYNMKDQSNWLNRKQETAAI